MEITEVRIFLKESVNSKLRAYATITIDNVFVVRNIKIIEGDILKFSILPRRDSSKYITTIHILCQVIF